MQTKIKPTKPYKDFPLFAHASGQWAKKIRGKMHYFGVWSDWRAALDKYQAQRDDLQAGRVPREVEGEVPRVKDLLNSFLRHKRALVETGELSERSLLDYQKTCDRIFDAVGGDLRLDDLRPADFERLRESYPKTWGVVTLGNEINRARTVFNYASPKGLGLIAQGFTFGPSFKRPSKKTQRIARGKAPRKLFTAEEIRKMIDHADPTLRAMILLGINCGFGNRDCADLRFGNLDGSWIDYPRPKTGVDRRAKLWGITKASIEEVAEKRSGFEEDRIFLTKYGRPFIHEYGSGSCPIAQNTRKLLDRLDIYRKGLSFYALRHTFQTIGETSGETVAVSSIMGHVDSSMAGNYRELIQDARLERVSTTVFNWLYHVSS